MSGKQDILVIGAKGMLGQDMVAVLNGKHAVTGIDIEEIDIADADQTQEVLADLKPGIVINCAAYTDVDRCESEPEIAFAVNALGAENLARACTDLGAKLVHFSTDYVFPGKGGTPYQESDPTAPINVYGASKQQGEEAILKIDAGHLIIRTAWLFGKQGKNFVKTMLKLADERDELKVVSDQHGSPTYTRDLAAATVELIKRNASGIVHVTNDGQCSWHEFACEIFRVAGKTAVKVHPVSTDEFPRPAQRPGMSIMDKSKYVQIVGQPMPVWTDALRRYLKEERE